MGKVPVNTLLPTSPPNAQTHVVVTVWSFTHVQFFATPWTVAHQAFLSFTVFWSLLKFVSNKSVMSSKHLILCHPLLWTFFGKVMSLLFNISSRLVIDFFPRNKCLLLSWLQSQFTVILEPKKIKSVTTSTFSPFICHEVMGADAMILVFEC